ITFQSFLKKPGFKNIVLPIDSSLHSRQKVDHAIEMASHFGATIKILGLVRTNEELDEKKFLIKIEAVEKALNKANINHDCKIVHGKNLAVETMQYSEEVKADLMMIMTDHESHLTGMFLGAFAKQIVNHSKIPVMSIKPIEGHYEPLDLSASSNPFVYY
ncbi:MAG: universal stress protein, partial [Bacteroidia bacterium]